MCTCMSNEQMQVLQATKNANYAKTKHGSFDATVSMQHNNKFDAMNSASGRSTGRRVKRAGSRDDMRGYGGEERPSSRNNQIDPRTGGRYKGQQGIKGGTLHRDHSTSSMMSASKRTRSRSTDHLPSSTGGAGGSHHHHHHHPAMSANGHAASVDVSDFNSSSIRKMLRPVHTAPDSPVTSPENSRSKRGGHHGHHQANKYACGPPSKHGGACFSETEWTTGAASDKRISASGIAGSGNPVNIVSPSSDVDIFDSQCFATTPSSSNENSDAEEPASPTSQLLIEYEEHLRNTLEKDSESFSLHTFEALLSRSMENLGEEEFTSYYQITHA